MENYYSIKATIGGLKKTSLIFTGSTWTPENGYDGSNDSDSLEDAISTIESEISRFRQRSPENGFEEEGERYDYTPEVTFSVTHWDEERGQTIVDYRKTIPYVDHKE